MQHGYGVPHLITAVGIAYSALQLVGSLRLHSRHAYACVAGLYGQGWNHIEEHISFCLARLCGHLGEPTAAISYFLQLLSGPSVGPQVTYLNEVYLHPLVSSVV